MLFSDTNRLWVSSRVSQSIKKAKQTLRPDNGGDYRLTYAPCQIRFTLLAKASGSTRSPMGQTKNSPQLRSPKMKTDPREAISKSTIFLKGEHFVNIGDNSDIARLVTSTLWLSDEAASGIWQAIMTKDQMRSNTNNGVNEALCVYHQVDMLLKDYHDHIYRGFICRAYLDALSMSLLTQNYQLTTALYRSLDCPPFKLNSIVHTIELCEHLLQGSHSSIHIAALWQTITTSICSCLRYFILSPQVAHLRGGCAYILKSLQSLEVLLKLSSSLPSMATDAGRLNDKAANQGSKSSSSIRRNIQPPLDRMDFESALRSEKSRVIPYRSESNPTDADATAIHASDTSNDISRIEMEMSYRFFLSQPKTKRKVVTLLHELRHLLHALLIALSNDMLSSFPEAKLSLGDRSSMQSNILARVAMTPSEQVFKIVTGYPTCNVSKQLSQSSHA